MENPATWGEAEKVISRALHLAESDRRDGFCGLSAERRIADALREAGLLLADPAALDDGQLDTYFSHLLQLAELENNRRAVRKLLREDPW